MTSGSHSVWLHDELFGDQHRQLGSISRCLPADSVATTMVTRSAGVAQGCPFLPCYPQGMAAHARRPATYDDLLAVADHLVAEILDGELHDLRCDGPAGLSIA
jgi:hypothetical protein